MKIGLKFLEISMDLCGKVQGAVEENKLNALEQLHITSIDDYFYRLLH